MENLMRYVRLPLFFLGLVAIFVVERYFELDAGIFRWLGIGLAAAGFVATVVKYFSAAGKSVEEGQAWRNAVLWQILVLAGVGLYFAYRQALGDLVEPETLAQKCLLVGWLGLLSLGIFMGLGVEWALWQTGEGSLAEPVRVQKSGIAWLSVGMLIVSVFALNFAAAKKNKTYDWSYFKTTAPSEATFNMVKTLTQDLEVILFYPETNDVRTQLDQYFEALAQKEPRVKITRLDKDLAPARAEELKVPRNGIVLLKYGEKNERIDTGIQLTKARATLKKLDSEIQKKFLVLTARQRTAYFTKGHGEATWLSQEEGSAEKSIQGLEAILRAQNYNIRQFGIAEGSATEVPPEVNVVVVVGHTRAFQQEEVDALKRFLDRGGSLMVFFDSNTADDTSAQLAFNPEGDALKEFLAKDVGINFNPAPLANEREHVNANRGEADRWFTITNIFTSHESVATLARHDERVALMLLRAGSLVVTPSTGQWQAMETVRSLASTFADLNSNFKFDEGQEKRDSYSIGAVATREVKVNGETKQSKVFAFSDATIVSDLLIRYPQMQIMFNDSIKWLVGDLEFGGDVSNEEDVKIIHTKKKNLVWFWGSIFVVPAFVILVGWVATRSIGQGRGRKIEDLDDAV